MAARAPEPANPAAIEWPRPAALALPAAWLLLLVLAPPAHNAFWGVNGLRSVSPTVAVLVLAAAAGAALLAARPAPPAGAAPLLASVVAAALAFPLRDALHALGDTATRHGAVTNYLRGSYAQPLAEWARQLHAQPLDLGLNLLLAARLAAWAGSTEHAFSIVSAVLALAMFACAWRIAGRLDAGRGLAWGLWLALVAWGGLQAFAGYAESAGLVIVTTSAWWLAMLAPLARPSAALRLAGAWTLAALSHRSALLLLAPLLVRAVGPPWPGDRAGVRTLALALCVAAAGCVAWVSASTGAGRLGADLADALRPLDPAVLASLPTDLANLLLLTGPLALAAAALAGREAWGAFRRDPRALAVGAAAVALFPLAVPLPVAANGLGVHRDWDLSVALGTTLTVGGALLLAHARAARLRGALVAALPVLVAGALGWVAVHADDAAALRRVEALSEGAPRLAPHHRSAVLLFAGNRAMDRGEPRRAARLLQASWALTPSPARGTHAAIAWLVAGETDSARRIVAALRARGALDARTVATLDTLDRQIELLERMRGAP